MAQNIPDLLTVSLIEGHIQGMMLAAGILYTSIMYIPAVNHDRLVSGPSLNLVHLFLDSYDTGKTGALSIMAPVSHMQLYDLVRLL